MSRFNECSVECMEDDILYKSNATLPNVLLSSGVHTGEVVVVRVSEEEVRTVEVVKWHARPITSLASHGLVLATGDDQGHITVAQDDQGLQNICCIDTYG